MFLNILNIEIKLYFEIIDLNKLKYIKNIKLNLIVNLFYIISFFDFDKIKKFNSTIFFEIL